MADESMTPDLVELTRQTYEAASRGDLDALVSFYAPDVLYDVTEAGLGTFEGVAAVRGFLGDWWGSFEEILDLGHGVVFNAYREDARPAGSVGRVAQRRAFVTIWVSGKVAWFRAHLDVDEARAAVERLAEEPG